MIKMGMKMMTMIMMKSGRLVPSSFFLFIRNDKHGTLSTRETGTIAKIKSTFSQINETQLDI